MKARTFLNSRHQVTKVFMMIWMWIVPGCLSVVAQKNSSEWLQALEAKIEQSSHFDNERFMEIDQYYQQGPGENSDTYSFYLRLFDEYSNLNFDSAYRYAGKLYEIARQSRDSSRIESAKIKLGFTLLSAGMYKEVFDTLRTIDLRHLNSSIKAEYYILKARCHYDLADYNQNEFYSPHYNARGNEFIDSALLSLPVSSFEYNYYNGLKFIRSQNDKKAAVYLERLVQDTTLSDHQRALAASTFADIFVRKEQFDSVISLLCEAAIKDIEASTKETSATYYLAILLFQRGDVKTASLFIQKAAEDAQFYGARQRVIQVNSQVPLIMEQLAVVDMKRKNIFRYAIIITTIFLALFALVFVIIRQVKRLKSQQFIINQKNDSLQNLLLEKDGLLAEKEWLRKEIHHRVKNNLQTVMSLLKSQSAFLKDGALLAIRDSQHRIYSMSLIHQKLYQSENVSSLDMNFYIPELINYLRDSFDPYHKIRFNVQIESVTLNLSQAVPLGIILTEAISNAMKYAFPTDKNGIINLTLSKISSNFVMLAVADNGVGLPIGFDTSNKNSLGIRLINGLSQDIDAKLKIESNKGTTITLEFEVD